MSDRAPPPVVPADWAPNPRIVFPAATVSVFRCCSPRSVCEAPPDLAADPDGGGAAQPVKTSSASKHIDVVERRSIQRTPWVAVGWPLWERAPTPSTRRSMGEYDRL